MQKEDFVTTTTFIFQKGKKVLDNWTFAQFCNTYLISCYIIRFTAMIKNHILIHKQQYAANVRVILVQQNKMQCNDI